jgi:hypothetical protein
MLQGCADSYPAALAGFAEALSNRLQKKAPFGVLFLCLDFATAEPLWEQRLWEQSLLAMAVGQVASLLSAPLHREQALLPQPFHRIFEG